MKDKLSARNYEARIVGYTDSHGTYRVCDTNRKTRLAKSPKAITKAQSIPDDSSSDEEHTAHIPKPRALQQFITSQGILDDILDEMESQTPDVPTEQIEAPEIPPTKKDKEPRQQRKINWPETVGERKSP